MNYDNSGYDSGALSPDENKPIKTVSKRTKRVATALACVLLGLAIAGGVIFLAGKIFTGASAPEKAAAEYVKASLCYDIDGMIDYSSQYNKVVLYGNRETSDRLLQSYLSKAYAEITDTVNKEDIHISLVAVTEYKEGDDTFADIKAKYSEKADAEKISGSATVTLVVNNGKNESTHTYVTVKIGSRWYYCYTAK